MRHVIAAVLIVALMAIPHFSASTAIASDARATLIVVEKQKHLMTVYSNDTVLHVYHVALGRGDATAKQRQGDNRTPEGHCVIDGRNDRTQFHKSLHISYPSLDDISRAKVHGYSPGGAALIHGLRQDLAWLGSLHRLKDWTRGCVAVTNAEMDELWNIVPIGTPVEIRQ